MSRSLAENVARGRRAIALARGRGMDTTAWEACLAELECQSLLAWASELAEHDLSLSSPVEFVEAPLRKVSTQRVSWYAAHYLTTIFFARLQKSTSGCGRWTPQWWKEREEEALGALAALRQAMEERRTTERSNDE